MRPGEMEATTYIKAPRLYNCTLSPVTLLLDEHGSYKGHMQELTSSAARVRRNEKR
jgi:hypothetical protein